MELIELSEKLLHLKDLIVKLKIQIKEMQEDERTKNWLFYTTEEKEEWYYIYFKSLMLREKALNRLNNNYIKTLNKITNDIN